MANQVNAPKFNSRNQPIEASTNTTGSEKLLISTVSSPENNVFEGIVYPKPSLSTVGVDFQPYVKNLVNMDEFSFQTSTVTFTKATQVLYTRMRNPSTNTLNYNQTSPGTAVNTVPFVCYKHLNYKDNLALQTAQPFGRLKYEINKGIFYYDWRLISASNYYSDDTILWNTKHSYQYTDGIQPTILNYTLKGAPVYLPYQHLYGLQNATNTSIFLSAQNASNINIISTQLYLNRPTAGQTMFIYTPITSTVKWFQYIITYPNYGINRTIYFEVVEPCNDSFQLYWINNRGGLDWIILNGKSTISKKIESKTYDRSMRSYNGTSFTGNESKIKRQRYLEDGYITYNLTSQFMKEEGYQWLNDIIDSEYVWLYNPKDESIKAVEVLDEDFTFKNFKNDKLFYYQIKLKEQWSYI